MKAVQYIVILKNGQWKVSFGGKHFGPYQSQRHAISYAVDAANIAEGSAQVLVQGPDSRSRVKWTYGRDPYPALD